MAADKKKIAADCWKKGSEAMGKENWDYAIDMFGKSAALMPENLVYRQSLRGVEKRKYNNNKSGKRLAGMSLIKIKTAIKNSRRKEDWANIDRAAESGLMLNPWNSQLNASMGEACSKLGYKEVAVFAYQCSIESEPNNLPNIRSLAFLLEERGEYTEAIKLWEKIYQLDSMDSEARSKITQLEAMDVMERGGYETAESIEDVKTGYDYDRHQKSASPEPEDGPGVSLEADLQRLIRKEPENKDLHLKLADYYRSQKRLEEAAEMTQKALDLSGNDPNIREQLEDIQLAQLRRNLEIAAEAARSNPDDETAKKNSVALRREYYQRRCEILESRVTRYPADTKLKYELGLMHMKLKRWQLAIPQLQSAVSDTRLRADVLVNLGICFFNDGKQKLALAQFEKAIPDIDPHDKKATLVKAHYNAGRLCEKAGDLERAEHHYTEVLTIDYDYKDARVRLECLQQGGGEAAAE